MKYQLYVKSSILIIFIGLIFCTNINSAKSSSKLLKSGKQGPENVAQDTTAIIDSVSSESDSLTAPKTSSTGLDTTLYYDAATIDVRAPDKKIYLIGNADVKYKTIHLTAGKIEVDWNTNLITAEGIPDTVFVPVENSNDSVKTVVWNGLPVLSDAGDVMKGFKMIFNFKTDKGRIIKGRTEFEGGYYSGESMKKVSKKIINFSNGYFTSCDKEDEPHFHFKSRRIKVVIGEKVIAKPVVMFLGHIPVAAMPFAVFPNKKGRTSGLLIPTYGESASEGRFIRGLGYYWAASEYYDASMKIDYFDRSGMILRGDTRYNKRYILGMNNSRNE